MVSGQATGSCRDVRLRDGGGDLVAEGLELADVVALDPFGSQAVVVEVGPQIVEVGVVVGQQMPDDDQDGTSDRNDGLLLAAVTGDPSITLTQERVGPAGGHCGFTQDPCEVGIAVTGGPGALLATGGLLHAGGELGPRSQMPGGGEPAHVHPDLRDDHVGCGASDTGDLIQAGQRILERGDLLLDPGV